MVKASIRLPRSWKCCGRATFTSGGCSARRPTTMTTKASVVNTCPAMSIRPNMVENQCGSSDIIQSTPAKGAVSPERRGPGRPGIAPPPRQPGVAARVELPRPLVQQVGRTGPGQEIEDSAAREEAHVQVSALLREHRVAGHGLRVRAFVA